MFGGFVIKVMTMDMSYMVAECSAKRRRREAQHQSTSYTIDSCKNSKVGVTPSTITRQGATATFQSRGAAKRGESSRYRACDYGEVLFCVCAYQKPSFLQEKQQFDLKTIFWKSILFASSSKTKEWTTFSIICY